MGVPELVDYVAEVGRCRSSLLAGHRHEDRQVNEIEQVERLMRDEVYSFVGHDTLSA